MGQNMAINPRKCLKIGSDYPVFKSASINKDLCISTQINRESVEKLLKLQRCRPEFLFRSVKTPSSGPLNLIAFSPNCDWFIVALVKFYTIEKDGKTLTARSSFCEKILFSWSRTGTIRMRKNGKAKEAAVDLTTHSMIRHITWTNVKMCIFTVRTWKIKQISKQIQIGNFQIIR